MKHLGLASFIALAATIGPAAAMESSVTAYVNSEVRDWFSVPQVLDAIAASNARTAGMTQNEILALDAQWTAEVGTNSILIDRILGSAVSDYLRAQVEATGGLVTEVIVMDAKGLNVAISDVTSDIYQGDEAKHQETFMVGPDAIHVSDVEFDESVQSYQMQVSFTVVDPTSGIPTGAVTIGLNAEMF
ncbi:hypothetical protein [Roseicitreum antarcticum]|uniref:Uncharacterized protein n=1 Tax=Roseicitreum antarcticum TaxID=564137 RepID=A0A1H3ASY4_9RHOB|nr:hypothetical protein [Roseicitreum antarcticum]SDX32715.1 hypothetical protein SAMN04488238_107120 [Roseicitreum antarcticum]